MEHVGQILVLVILGLVVALVLYHNRHTTRKRRRRLMRAAQLLGWSFVPDAVSDDVAEPDYMFSIFGPGYPSARYNTLMGSIVVAGEECRARAGDFMLMLESRRTRNTHHFSYMVVRLPFPAIPNLVIRRETIQDRLSGSMGLVDINFESFEFSRKFHVWCTDTRFAYDLIHPGMMEYLLHALPTSIHLEHNCCCFSRGEGRWAPEDFFGMVRWVQGFFNQWPAHLVERLKA